MAMKEIKMMVTPVLIVLIVFAATSAKPTLNETMLVDSCTVTDYYKVDAAVKSCKNLVIYSINVPAGKTLLLHLQSGTKLTFKGVIKFEYKEWDGPLVEVKGKNIEVTGESGHIFDADGAKYWDSRGDNGRRKPKLFKISGTSGKIVGINILNCPRQCVSISQGSYLTLSNWYLDVSAGDKNGGANTDGFDISQSEHVTIENSIVKNQDDCVAVNSGKNLVFNKLGCYGGHGLSLSIGVSTSDSSRNYAENITFSNSIVQNSRNAIHVKTHTDGASGYINGLTYRNIQISGITNYGINVQQDYRNGGSTGIPASNIPITNMEVSRIQGTMASSNSMPVYILCGSSGCKNFNWSGISITGGQKSNSCNFQPSGFRC